MWRVLPSAVRSANAATTPRSPAGAALTMLGRPVRGSSTGAATTGPRNAALSQAAPLYDTPAGAGPRLEQLTLPFGKVKSRCVC